MVTMAILLWLLTTTHALIAGAWDKWEQYLLGPVPISLGIFIATYSLNSAYAVVLLFLVLLFMSYEVTLASQLKKQLLVFNPRLVLKFVSKGTVLAFSFTAAILVIISAGKQPDINIGNTIGEFVDRYLSNHINAQINDQVQQGLSGEQLERLAAFGLDPSLLNNPKVIEGDPSEILRNLQNRGAPEFSLQNVVATEVNKIIEPYKKFLNPLMAVMVFGLVQFLGTIAYLFYSLLIDLIFSIAKKIGFFKTETIPAEKQILHF